MIQLTKIVHFETAHAIDGYPGACKHIHGHSYELQVTVEALVNNDDYIPAPGFIVDFKELKRLVQEQVIAMFDHRLILSEAYLQKHPGIRSEENLMIFEAEPTAENILIYIQRRLSAHLPAQVQLAELTLYETKDSFARWVRRS